MKIKKIILFLLMLVLGLSLFAELWINKRALVVSYEGKWYFPTYTRMIPGDTFGFDYQYETNYRDLKLKTDVDFVFMPLIPWDAYESDFSYEHEKGKTHLLGLDFSGRDVLARLVYGFRLTFFFSLLLLIISYSIGIMLGIFMGYRGGWPDLIFQRLVEIWSHVPFLYLVMLISTFFVKSLGGLLLVMVLFGWIHIATYMRSATYKEKERQYILAIRALGASPFRIIFYHIFPNVFHIALSLAPFSLMANITTLTALDFLGFGLQAPTPSLGELLGQGLRKGSDDYRILISVLLVLSLLLVVLTFLGNSLQEHLNPKKNKWRECQ